MVYKLTYLRDTLLPNHRDLAKDLEEPVDRHATDYIRLGSAATLGGVFAERVRRSPNAPAYRQNDDGEWRTYSWAEMAREAGRWQAALRAEGLEPGERVALMLRNSREWALFDLAAQALGLVTVPIFTNDRPENIGYILQDSGAQVLLLEGQEQWDGLETICDQLAGLRRILTLRTVTPRAAQTRMGQVNEWLPELASDYQPMSLSSDALATIVYTSGTTGRSKGVMLSHRNMLWDIEAGLKRVPIYPDDLFLSFLPLSHTLERTVGYYMPIVTGACVAFARSVPQLGEDLLSVRPTVLVAVPRIFERVQAKIQTKLEEDPAPVRALFRKAADVGWRRFLHRQKRGPRHADFLLWPLLDRLVGAKVRAKLGGRLRFAICGGAPLGYDVARLFIGLGVDIVQGYGLTETSPIISCNTLTDNEPRSVGRALPGLEVRLGPSDELLVRGPAVMLGYWNNPEASRAVIDAQGWFHTGDIARLSDDGIFITGRLKEIIVLANGEKVPPADMEMAVLADPLVDQIVIVGEGRPFLTALVVPSQDQLPSLAAQLDVNADDPGLLRNEVLENMVLERVQKSLHSFPGYAKIVRITLIGEPWTVDNGMLTPTLKMRRNEILKQYAPQVEHMYKGH